MKRPRYIATPKRSTLPRDKVRTFTVECPKCGWEGEAYAGAQCPDCDTYLKAKRA